MKKYLLSYVSFCTIAGLIIITFFSNCNDGSTNNINCDGYTGEINNKNSAALIATCHFITKDFIDSWTARYQKNKSQIGTANFPASNVLSDSSSFNNSIVKAIITNDSCIGLRVINGMDIKNKVHLLLVGIKPDYTTLYIGKPIDCDGNNQLNKNEARQSGEPEDDLGGGEMALEP